jgi:signal transduction histidine kinase
MVRPLATTRRIQMVNEVAEHDDRHVRADQQRFRQVLLNLLANAIKYNSDGGRVTVSCAASGMFLRFNVSDTGSGLTTEEMGKLFVPFERLGAAKLQVEGTGLGLVLCKKLVDGGADWRRQRARPGQHFLGGISTGRKPVRAI